jgi:Flp pilus assembly protein TadD
VRRRLGFALTLVVVLAGVYANTLDSPFVFDDRGTVLDNPTIESLTDRAVLRAPTETPTAGRPVVNVLFALNYAMDGRDVVGYHLVNIALHVACALLLFALTRRLTGDEWAAFVVALLWGVHPLTTEVVNYLTQRTESTMALCLLGTLWAAVRAHDEPKRRRWLWVAIGACALGMGSKETMVVAPVLVVLMDRAFLFPTFADAWSHRRRLYVGLAATWLVLGALQLTEPRTISAGLAAHDANVWTYLLNQAVIVSHYFRLAVWPDALALYYGGPVALTLADVWPQALFIVVLLAASAWAWTRRPRAGWLAAVVWVTLAPTSSLIPIVTEVGADRRMYLPLMALVAGAVMLIRLYTREGRRPYVAAALGVVCVITLSARTIARNTDYASSLTLAQTTVDAWPGPGGRSMLGTELANAGRLAEAETQLRLAADQHPPARYFLATVLEALGREDEAITHYLQFIGEQPAALDQVRLARGHLARIYSRRQAWAEARDQYRAMVSAAPGDLELRSVFANTLVRTGDFAEAVAHYQRYLTLAPTDTRAMTGLAIALSSLGRHDDALVLFRRVVDAEPGNAAARDNLARALAAAGR